MQCSLFLLYFYAVGEAAGRPSGLLKNTVTAVFEHPMEAYFSCLCHIPKMSTGFQAEK